MPDEATIEAPETEVTDESTNTTVIITPPVEDDAPAGVPQHEHGPCEEAGRANARIDELIATMAEHQAEEEEEEHAVEEAPAETVIEEPPAPEDEAAPSSGSTGHMAPGWF